MSDEELDLDIDLSDDEDLAEEGVVVKSGIKLDGRHRVEDKLEELRLQRLTQDYDFI